MNLRSTLLLVATLASTTVAHGQPVEPVDPAALAYQEGRRLYDIQEWDAAIAKFKEAYKLRSDAASLFNIAQAYRLKGDCAQAVTFYKTYARNFPKAENLAKVEKFITELESTPCKAAPTTMPDPTIDTTLPDPATVEPASDPDAAQLDPSKPIAPVAAVPDAAEPGHRKRLVGYSLVGVGGVALVAGGVYAWRARSRAKDVENAAPGTVWNPMVEAEGERYSRNATILFAVSGAALVGAGVLLYLAHSDAEGSYLSMAPGRDGATLVWSGAF
ncbi:MAG: hypothetical protein H0T79_13130 [Deltaproteobacteria bacterium]|nr:hypothetical protein [Deltaproteobacteria bacterium]